MVRILFTVLVAAVIGGGVVYGAMLYLGRSPLQVDLQVSTSSPMADAEPTATSTLPRSSVPAQPAATISPTASESDVPTPTPPAATVAPTSTTTTAVPTEREIVLQAFGSCDGQYSGADQRFRTQTADSAITDGRQTVADIRKLVEQYCGGAFPQPVAAQGRPASTPKAQPVVTTPPKPTATPRPTVTPRPTDTPTATATSPDLRHIEEKQYMLELINAEREKAGVDQVALSDNIAAQLHAEAALQNCFSSHWGVDGLKPYMRYSLAGGFQSNGENGSGLDYCITSTDGYRAIASIEQAIRDAVAGWMNSSGHRRNLLDPQHRRANISIAWDRYNTAMFQHFEGDYVEYDQLPHISDGVLTLSGQTTNGVRFGRERDLGLQIYYDPPPDTLTLGQVARTYCYDNGRLVASLREPLSGRISLDHP